jgi:hypothetical protein
MIMIPLRIGTPEFMARLVRIPTISASPVPLHHVPMPQLKGDALELYEKHVGKRLSEFPENKMLTYEIKKGKDIRNDYKHRLSYDAESILWLLLYWAIQIQPSPSKEKDRIPGTVDKISADIWVLLTGGDGKKDSRRKLVPLGTDPLCHPYYKLLDALLRSLFQQLSTYQEYVSLPSEGYKVASEDPDATVDTRKEEEYLHEAFQRTILDFIVENIKQPFMNATISPIRRKPEKDAGVSQSRTTAASVKRSLDDVQGTVTDMRNRKKRKMLREETVTGNETVGGAERQTRSGM